VNVTLLRVLALTGLLGLAAADWKPAYG